MQVAELRAKYLAFFQAKEHQLHASGSLVPYDVTGRLDESLLFNGAGMIQFKPYFRGAAQPPHPRLVTAQKCLRTGDIEEVGDDSHLTFFEMLGNFSFGDYFKEGAIRMSWEFLTGSEWLNLDPKRLTFTVFEEDDESHALWSECFRSVGLDPEPRIIRLDEKTNYWPAGAFSKGPPGPCGPNTEMFYWTGKGLPDLNGYTKEQWLADDAAGRWMEIWNDVFIQSEWQGEETPDGWRKTGMPDLPFRSVDTGMGLERTAVVLGGCTSVYETDAFAPILEAIRTRFPQQDTASERVVSDHLRAACFCLADGILPGNTGRGYVLRRLIRRAVLKGVRHLKGQKPFLADLSAVIVDQMGGHYPELADRRALIAESLDGEEEQFRATLSRGEEMLAQELEGASRLDGEKAFMLYDTFGFPLEVTQELAQEKGVEVDVAGFKSAMAEAQEKSRGASGMESVYGGVEGESLISQSPPTEFLGYDETSADAELIAIRPQLDPRGRPTGRFVAVLDRTPFYAESGGQVNDIGTLSGEDWSAEVRDVQKREGVWLHVLQPRQGELSEDLAGSSIRAEVEADRRTKVTRNHTATHLLHAALRKVLGEHVTQAGSFVAPDHLRFDFTHKAGLSTEERDQVERIVNDYSLAALGMTTYPDVPLEEARAMGAMALFGEKYADRVRVVQVGTMDPGTPSFSRELCGGIHVGSTGEIGLFKLTGEGSAASGVRRIMAVTGTGAYDWVREQEQAVADAAARMKSSPRDLVMSVEKLLEQIKEERRQREKMAAQRATSAAVIEEEIGGVMLRAQVIPGGAGEAKAAADALVEGKPNAVGVALAQDAKLLIACKCGDEAVKAGAHAGNLVKAAAQAAGGGGGGRPNFATAGAPDPQKAEAAINAVRQALQGD